MRFAARGRSKPAVPFYLAGIPGPQGPQGPTGPRGLTGPQGIQGLIGPQGLPGEGAVSGSAARYAFDDWDEGSVAGNLNWQTVSAGSGSGFAIVATGVDPLLNAAGVVQLNAGTSASGRACIHRGTANYLASLGTLEQEWRILPLNLSTPTQRYSLRIGFGDTVAAGDHVDGAYFEYDDSQGLTWRCCTASNSSRTKNAGAVLVTNQAFTHLRIRLMPLAAEFYINGALAQILTTNLPTGAGRHFGVAAKLEKSIGNGVNQALLIDYYRQFLYFAAPR